jgi:YidC/Oxa1 family membrane protein insertase
MADINGPQKSPNAEPAMEKRMLLAFLLMGAILFATPYIYRTFAPQQAPQKTAVPAKPVPQADQTAASAAEPKQEAAEPREQLAAAAPVAAAKEEPYTIETEVYRITFSNRGAVVRSWLLKKFRDSAGKPLDLVNPSGAAKVGYPFALEYKDRKPSVDLNSALWAIRPSDDRLGVVFRYSNGRTSAEKSFTFDKSRYLAQFSSEVSENGSGIQHLIAWRGGFGDTALQNSAGNQRALYFDVQSQKLSLQDARAAKDGPVDHWGQYSFAGVQDNYFASVFLPRTNGQTQFRVVSDDVKSSPNSGEALHAGAAVGGDARNRFDVFVGPKDYNLLKRVDKRLPQLVDFGTWFGWLARPLFLILNWINDSYVHNYGWAIIVVTIFINIALMPLRFSSIKSMKRMSDLQPQIQAINAKYKGVGLRDPKNQQKNAEVMELYKKHGINPMGGCLPMLIQMPFFIAFYTVLTVAIEMRGANWLWVTDLSQPEHIPIRILPIAMIIAQFFQQKMTPNPSADPSQQRMMMLMPLIFGFMFYSASSGLVLYWLATNLVGIVQQLIINKTMGVPTVPQTAAVTEAPSKRKTGNRR